jgi:[DsrC]-trisulfide reductase subunit M
MKILASLFAVGALIALVVIFVGTMNLYYIFGIIIPIIAFAVFVLGFIFKIIGWAKTPVPFKIPTTCGQQYSLPWIKNSPLESPHTKLGVIGRMALEILFFRSLFRNTKAELREGPKLAYATDLWLWAAGLAFHYSFLVVIIRHFRFFIEPVPMAIGLVEALDGFFQIGLPIIYITDGVLVGAATVLLIRRIGIPQMRYISLVADYFPMFLILAIACSGICMRYFVKVDLIGVKQLTAGLLSFQFSVPAGTLEGIGIMFYIHLFLVCILLMYFPFSKLMHMGGVFLSPTRNMPNDNRMNRHINPWNPKVRMHTYEEYEDEFREIMKDVGIPVDKE